MVEEVEEFSANLEPILLRQMDTTRKGCIRIEVSGTDDRVAAQISECEGGGRRECRRVEPMIGRTLAGSHWAITGGLRNYQKFMSNLIEIVGPDVQAFSSRIHRSVTSL